MGAKKKLLILNEFAIIQKGLSLIIENEDNLSIVGKTLDTNEFFDLLRKTNPDIILLNLSLPNANINLLCKNIHAECPQIPILLLLDCATIIHIPEAIINGVRGIIWKENSDTELVEAINKVSSGGLYFENPYNCKLTCRISQKLKDTQESEKPKSILSKREIEVVKLFVDGLSYKEIGNTLHISPRTVETHKNNIQSKLNLTGLADIIRHAVENDLVS